MDPQLIRVVFGVLLLLLLVLLPVRGDTGGRRAFVGILLGIAASLAAVGLILWAGDFVIDDGSEAFVKFDIDVLSRDQEDHVPKNLVILEGSSQTALGVDSVAVERELREAGYDATVIQLSGAGGNHLERYRMISRLLVEMRRHGLRLSPNTHVMLEVAPEYDLNPTAYLISNEYTLRGYNLSDFGNLWFAYQSARIINGRLTQNNQTALGVVFRDSLISGLHIGLLTSLRRFDSIAGVDPFGPAATPAPGFRFSAYAADKYVKHPVQPLRPRQKAFTEYRTAHILRLFKGTPVSIGYFSVPTIRYDKQMRYARALCRWQSQAPCIDATDPTLYGALDSPGFYFNMVHLTAAGAVVYSHYFAQQLIAQKVVTK